MTSKPGRLGVFPLDPGRLSSAGAHPVIPASLSIVELAPVVIWATNASGACVAMTGAWERFTGRPPDAAAGDGWLAFVHDEDRARLKAAHLSANARRERFQVEARFRRADGRWEWTRIFGAPQVVEGSFRGFTGCAVRAGLIRSEREDAERDREVLGWLADQAWDALVVVDGEGRIVRTNSAARHLFASRAGIDGESLSRFVPEWRSARSGLDDAPTLDVKRGDGSVVTTRGRALVDIANVADRSVVAVRRVDPLPPGDERRGMAPGTGAADLLHELSNVVTALLAGCELVRSELPEGHPAQVDVEELADNVRRAQDITSRLKPPQRGTGDPESAPEAARAYPSGRGSGAGPKTTAGRAASGARRGQPILPTEVVRGRSILVVDDEVSIRRGVRVALEAAGAVVHDARHGADALLTWSELRGAVDLVVTDLRMPEMGGDELAERLRKLRPDLPILYVSGYALDRMVRRRPGDGFLSKPFTNEDLIEAASRVLTQPGAGV